MHPKYGVKHRLHGFEEMLRELSHRELQHMLDVLQRHDTEAARERLDLVRREMDGRKFVYMQPSLVAP